VHIFGLVTRKQKPGSIGWKNVANLCDRAKMLGYRLRLIILGTGPVGEEDREGAKEFEYPGLEVVTSEDVNDLTRAIGECTVLASMKFHGCVVAFMYGVPTIGLITTDKFRNFYKLTERPELLGHHRHTDLDKRLSFYQARIPGSTIRELRGGASAGLERLRAKMLRDLSGDPGGPGA
jgi:polysaccharide pyruvyl transferase WcaK-like protein